MQPIQFGTDGVRGRSGDWPITEEGARHIGRAIAAWCQQGPVYVGRDTRASGPALTEAIITGLNEGGSDVLDGGVMPTAAVSCAVASGGCAAGVVLTASHNPWHDNGIKVLNAGGRKPTDITALEALFGVAPTPGGGRRTTPADPLAPWRMAMPALDLTGARILLDCAHGAASAAAPGVLRSMGAQVVEVGCSPDGRNINDGVGATHPPTDLAGCDLGIILDGDADRILLLDEHGILDGDDILWALAQVTDGPVVGTVMTNGGLQRALGERLLRAKVGDKYVADLMATSGALVGAETSGHVLFADGMPTGDGLYAALRVIKATEGYPRVPGWSRLPVAQRSIRYSGQRRPLDSLTTPDAARAAGERVIIRYSGTEPVLRILVEGEDAAAWLERIAAEFQA
ncbi:MAG: phosphoglucosamine mutase [Myxococcota bacterium]|jgi:phosphoglucosamine mutase